jgi:hypothetical protein
MVEEIGVLWLIADLSRIASSPFPNPLRTYGVQ